MKFVGMILSVFVLFGCAGSVRAPAREATLGFVDALGHPEPNNQLARKIRDLVDKYVDTALKAGPPPGIDEVSRDVAEGLLTAVSAHAPEERAAIQALVHDAATAALRAAKTEMAPSPAALGRSGEALSRGLLEGVSRNEDAIVRLLSESAGAAGKALTRASGGELLQQLTVNFEENAPLSQALTTSAERATSALVRGVAAGIAAEVGDCSSNDPASCKDDFVRRLSRSAAMGATEGVGRKLEIWELLLATALGVVLAVVGHWVWKRIVHRGHVGGRPLRVALRRAPGPRGTRRRMRRARG